MAAMRPMDHGQAAHWYVPSATCNRSYVIALLRAGIIAALLIGVLALLVLT